MFVVIQAIANHKGIGNHKTGIVGLQGNSRSAAVRCLPPLYLPLRGHDRVFHRRQANRNPRRCGGGRTADFLNYYRVAFDNDDYRNWDAQKVTNFKKLADLVEAESGEKVEYIDYRNPKDVYIKLPTANIRLGSLNPSIFDKIQRLPSLLPQVKMINKKVKYILLLLLFKQVEYLTHSLCGLCLLICCC